MLEISQDSRAFRHLFLAAIFIVIVVGLKYCAYMVNLLVVSLVLTMLALPLMEILKKKGVSDVVAVTVITVAACMAILVMILLMIGSFQVLVNDIPLYWADLQLRLSELSSIFQKIGIDLSGMTDVSEMDMKGLSGMLAGIVFGISDIVLYLFFIGVITFFMLLEMPKIPGRVTKLLGKKSEKLDQFSRMSNYMIEFIIVRTETNFVHGFLFGGFLWVMGVHSALLWGILTFILSYIPYIGLIIAAVPAIFFAWLQFGVWGAVAVIAAVCVLNAVVENPVFSYLASRRFELPALLVIISVIFWGWVLGIFGMIFAVPITIMLIIVIQLSDEVRWLNTLIGVDGMFTEEKNIEKK